MASHCGKHLTRIHPLASHKTGNMVLQTERIVFGQCCAMPSCGLSFFSGSRWWNHLSSPVTLLWLKSWPLTVYCFSSCEESFCHWSLCFSVTQRGTLEAQTFWHPKFSTIFWTTWFSILVSVAISLIVTHPFSLMSSVFPLFWYSSWATSMVLVSDV